MRLNKSIICLVMLLGMSWASTANAAPAWYVAEVVATGVAANGAPAMRLSDTNAEPAFTNQWFFVTQAQGAKLATALTAISSGLTVWVNTDLSVPGVPDIFAIYVRQ